MQIVCAGNVFRGTGGSDVTTRIATLRPHVDNPVGRLDQIQVVLDHNYRVPLVNQFLDHIHQHADVLKMEARGGFIHNIDGIAGTDLGKLTGQFHPLGLAAADRCTRLADLQIPQAHTVERFNDALDTRVGIEKGEGFADGHFQHIGDVLALVVNFERFPVVAPAVAALAGYIYVGQEIHFDLFNTVAATLLAAAAFHVKGEPALTVTADFRLRHLRKQLPYRVEHFGVRSGIGSGRAPDRALINGDNLVDVIEPLNVIVGQGHILRFVEMVAQNRYKGLVDERTFSASAHTGNTDEFAQGHIQVHIFQVMPAGTLHTEYLPVAGPPLFGNADLLGIGHEPAGERRRIELFHLPLRYDLPAVDARSGTKVNYIVGIGNGFPVMFHHNHAVAQVAQQLQGIDQLDVVALMQPDAWFIQYIENTHKLGADLGSQAYALGFAAAQGLRFTVEAEIAQTYIQQKVDPVADLLEHLAADRSLPVG